MLIIYVVKPKKPLKIMQYGLHVSQVPAWLRFEELTTHYRLGPATYAQALCSLFRAHNECINAWTMIVASVLSTVALAYVLAVVKPTRGDDLVPFVALWFSAMIHLPFSVGYHLFMPISPDACNLWRKLDIAAIFASSCVLTFAIGYFVLPKTLLVAITLCAALVTVIAWARIARFSMSTPLEKRSLATFIGSIVLIYLAPMLLQSARDLVRLRRVTMPVAATLGVLVSLFVGGMTYVTSFPERFFPGTFDLVGSSHQIMHVAIAAAHMCEFAFILGCYRRRAHGNDFVLKPADV